SCFGRKRKEQLDDIDLLSSTVDLVQNKHDRSIESEPLLSKENLECRGFCSDKKRRCTGHREKARIQACRCRWGDDIEAHLRALPPLASHGSGQSRLMRMHALDTKLQREVALILIAAPQQPRLVSTGTSPSENVLHFA